MPHVLIVGDSQAAGPMGARLARRLTSAGWDVQRLAEVGWTADRWMNERGPEVQAAARGADLVLVVLGTNDIYRADRTRSAAEWFKGLGDNVWWIGAPNYQDANLQARVNGTKTIFQSVFGDHYIDSRRFTSATCVGRTPDCIHFQPSGGAVWADAVYSELNRRRGPSTSGWLGPASLALGALALVIAIRRRRI